MILDWPLTGRDEEIHRLRTTVTDEGLSVVLAGPMGVGKTRLCNEAVDACRRAGLSTARVTATRSAREIPLGAFAPLLPSGGDDPQGTFDNPAALLRRCAEVLVRRAAGRQLLVGVDDAHLLDFMSATLLHQLVERQDALVVVTVRSSEHAPDAVASLWTSGHARRVEVSPLGVPAMTDLLAAVLGGAVDGAAVEELARRSGGNLLFLRELVMGARAAGVLVDDGGVWRLHGELHANLRLTELVEARLRGLADMERAVLEVVAFGEPTGPAELAALCPESVVDGLERKGMLRASRDGLRTAIRLEHPVYADVLRDRVPVLRARAINRLLADTVEAVGARRREDLLRLAGWRLTGGGGQPRTMYAAALEARWRYDFPLAERLARAAVRAGGDFEAAVLAAKLAGLQGRPAQADAELAALAGRHAENERGLVALARLDNLVIYSGNLDEGLRIADEARRSVEAEELRREIEARRVALLIGKEGPRRAVAAAEPLLDLPGGRALAWACMPGSYALARVGRLGEAADAARRGARAHAELDSPTDWYPWMHTFYEAEALTHSGQLLEAERIARTRYHEGLADRSLEEQALFGWQLGKAVTDRGNVVESLRNLLIAIAIYRQLDRPQFVNFCLIYKAQALAVAHRPDEARAALEELDRLGVGPSRFMGADLLLARGWTEAAAGQLRLARDVFRSAAREGEEMGDLVGAVAALHSAARIGYAKDVVDRLVALAAHVDGPLAAARAAHAQALVRGDARQLEAVSADFEAMGAALLAAETAADGSVMWARQGDRREAAALGWRVTAIAARCEGAHTPALWGLASRVDLTRAEWEAAQLAAKGCSNRQIARQLALSIRTVENRLQQVYGKLGVRSRAALGDALGTVPDPVRGPAPDPARGPAPDRRLPAVAGSGELRRR